MDEPNRASEPVEVRQVPERSRYEILSAGRMIGFASYARLRNKLLLTHTEVEQAERGRGVGSALVRGALDNIRAQGLVLRPLCPFVVSWLTRHEDYLELVDPVDRDRITGAKGLPA